MNDKTKNIIDALSMLFQLVCVVTSLAWVANGNMQNATYFVAMATFLKVNQFNH